ncbi:uncharacterized protein LOC124281823 isoform X2 [Haliotis rubra]|uniref:uncharacterized protein LOC124281823 isoform X2 n=1 Tax=Haliotis rubra TaxID=36100 RepID=UPI001EE5F830|nr:uncharacterized protein LOC124281823 isoform X2 [Haliotis rubra]
MWKINTLLCLSLLTSVVSQLRWERIHSGATPSSPSPRRDVAIGFHTATNQVIIFGGRPGPLDDTWIFNVTEGKWREVVASVRPAQRYTVVGGVSGDYFYVTTGEGRNNTFYNDIWRFHMIREEWEELPAQKRPPYISGHDWATLSKTSFRPEARYGSGGGIFPGGGRMYVSQGFSNVRYFDTFTYDVNALGWQREHCASCHPYDPRYPHARCLHASTTISNDELVIFGGCLRTYASMAELPSTYGRRRVVLYGGFEEGEQVLITNPSGKDVVAVLSPETGKWSQRKTTAVDEVISTPGRRASTGMVTGRSGIFMFGGVDINMNALLSDLWFLRGNARDADHSEEVACSINFVNLITIHGVLMVIGWGVFLQWGAFVARYMKFKSGLWFYVHVFFQVFGLCCVVAGLVFSILSVQFDHFKFTHAIIGLVATTLAALQPLNALIRPLKIPDNDDTKTQRRRVWECIHHFGGRCALLLAFINISLGVFLGVAQMVIWALWFSYLGFIVFVYGMAELCRSVYGRRRVDTLGDSDPVEKTKYNFVDIPKEPPTDYITGETNGL